LQGRPEDGFIYSGSDLSKYSSNHSQIISNMHIPMLWFVLCLIHNIILGPRQHLLVISNPKATDTGELSDKEAQIHFYNWIFKIL
jgi:hypothetical protein